MKLTRKQLRVIVLMPMLIASFTVLPPLMMSERVSATHECGGVDRAVLLSTFTYVNNDKCMQNHVDHAVTEVRDAESSKTKLDLYTSALSQNDSERVNTVLQKNNLQETESVVWLKVEKSIAEDYEAGLGKSAIKANAKEVIANYYAQHQKNVIKSFNSSTDTFTYLYERTQQEGEINSRYVGERKDVTTTRGHEIDNETYYKGKSATDVTLVNGNTTQANELTFQPSESAYSEQQYTVNVNSLSDSEIDTSVGSRPSSEYTINALRIKAPNENYDNHDIHPIGEQAQIWSEIEDQNTQMQDEADVFVENIYNDLETGNIDTQDVISRTTQMFEYGVESSGNSSYYNVIGALAGMGLETGNLNQTGQMQVEYAGSTYTGMLFADNVPNGEWVSDQTYNPENISGVVIMATSEGERITLKNSFTIQTITDKEGNEQDSAETTKYNYKTANSSELQNTMDSILSLSQELENRSASVGGSGTNEDSGNGILQWLKGNTAGVPNGAIVLVGIGGIGLISKRRN